MSGRDVVVFGTHPFVPGVPLGDWHIARALSRRHRVLWIDPPTAPLATRRTGGRGRPVATRDGVLVARPVVATGRPLPALGTVTERLVVAQANRWTRQLGMSAPDAISFSPRLGALRGLRRRRLAAWLKDRDWAAVGVEHRGWLRDRQAAMVRGADVVTAVSAPLVADCRALGVEAVLLPNGCDAPAAPAPEPSRWHALPRPRIVFAGAWNERADADLVSELAGRLPSASIVVIGAVSTPTPLGANVHVVGPVAHDEIATHLAAADVGIIPYRSSAFNEASCPLKLFEYLAAGLPVVAAAVDVTAAGDEDLVRRADGADAFAAAVADLAGRDVRARCTALATTHTWDRRAERLLAVMDASEGRTR